MNNGKKYITGIQFDAKPLWILTYSMGKNMNISDVIIRYLAIENYYNKNDDGFNLYSKMQKIRVNSNKRIPKYRDDQGTRFKKLIHSYEEKGYNLKYPVQLNKDFKLFDGAHRLALALYYDEETIPVYVDFTVDYTPDYSIDWFEKHEMKYYSSIIKDNYKRIIENKAIKYILLTHRKSKQVEEYFKDAIIKYKEQYLEYKGVYVIYDLLLENSTNYSCGMVKNINHLYNKIVEYAKKKDIDFIVIGGKNEK